jgi:23S rRNA (pseudouridine1915-N3)-methyltransferase
MLKIKIIVVDRTRAPFIRDGESFYLKRLERYVQMEWAVVKPVGIHKGRPEREIIEEEGNSISRRVNEGDYLIGLDRRGRQYDSEGLSGLLGKLSARSGGWVCFAIGGPLGLSPGILNRCDKVLSLSRLTLTHEMSRLILLEQIYRAMTILRGEKYHK